MRKRMHDQDTIIDASPPTGATVIGQGRIDAGPIGAVDLAWSEKGIVWLRFAAPGSRAPGGDEVPAEYAAPLRRYFGGDGSVDPATLPIDYAGQGTPKQRRVWDALRTIPRGEVRSYSWLARQVRSIPRAVGQANARNPIAIVVPCHRVVDADDALGGYTGGLDRKVTLLGLEGLDVRSGKVTKGQLTLG